MLVVASCFIGAFIFGWLTWIARNVWRNKTATQLFALITVAFTLTFMILAWEML